MLKPTVWLMLAVGMAGNAVDEASSSLMMS